MNKFPIMLYPIFLNREKIICRKKKSQKHTKLQTSERDVYFKANTASGDAQRTAHIVR